MKEKIENILIRNNLNPYLKGFAYIVSCIEYMFENNVSPSEIRVCKELYVEVGLSPPPRTSRRLRRPFKGLLIFVP